MWIQAIAEPQIAWSVNLTYRPLFVWEAFTMDVIDDNNSEVVIIHVPENVDELLVQSLCFQYLEHPGNNTFSLRLM